MLLNLFSPTYSLMQDEAASKPDIDHFLSPNKPIAPKPVSRIQPIPEDWHIDSIAQVAWKKFDPSMLADDDKLKNVSDQLSIVLEHKNIAVVTGGLVESKAPKFGIKFVEKYMLGKESLCLVALNHRLRMVKWSLSKNLEGCTCLVLNILGTWKSARSS